MSADGIQGEDLYTKIALDNKLVTRFQVRKATEEQEAMRRDGNDAPLGDVMVRLGFLSERQHQSVLNACRYREQRDTDKRFGRQCLRMELLDQDAIEKALDVQKDAYQANGAVRSLQELLVEQGRLSGAQAAEVLAGIEARDRARGLGKSGKTPSLSVSGPTPVLAAKAAAPAKGAEAPAKAGAKPSGVAKGGDDDLDDADLDDADLDGADLDDADLDLDGVDLDDDDEGDEDDDDLDGDLDDGEDEPKRAAPAKAAPARAGAPAQDADDDLDLDGVDLDADESDEDEDDLAKDVSELGSDVELDDADIAALDAMDSGEETDATEWAAEAFDDRPLSARPPSERLGVVPSARAAGAGAPPPTPNLPAAPPRQPKPPVAPTAARSARLIPDEEPVAAATAPARPEASSPFVSGESDHEAPPPPPPPDIPGGEVLEGVGSGSARLPAAATTPSPASSGRAPTASDPVDEEDSTAEELSASEVGRIIDAGQTGTGWPSTSSPGPDLGDLEPLSDEARPIPASPAGARRAGAGSDRLAESAAALRAEIAADPAPDVPTGKLPRPAAAPPLDLEDPRVRRAFDQAMQAAWRTFTQALREG